MINEEDREKAKWFKSMISRIDHGHSWSVGRKRRASRIQNKQIVEFYAEGRRIRSISNNDLLKSCYQSKIVYYTSNPRSGIILVSIDVDGPTAGSIAFGECLKSIVGANLYEEVVPIRLFGTHFYFLIKTGDTSPAAINTKLRYIEAALQSHAQGFDVEVSIHGTCCEYNAEKGHAQVGRLASVPLGLFNRFDELRNTVVVDCDRIEEVFLILPPASVQLNDFRRLGEAEIADLNSDSAIRFGMDMAARDYWSVAGPISADCWRIGGIISWFMKQKTTSGYTSASWAQFLWNQLMDNKNINIPWNYYHWGVMRSVMGDWGMTVDLQKEMCEK